MDAKVNALADLIRASSNMIAYTGAGISTAAGIDDYATKGREGSVVCHHCYHHGDFNRLLLLSYRRTNLTSPCLLLLIRLRQRGGLRSRTGRTPPRRGRITSWWRYTGRGT